MNINNVVFERSFGTSSQLPASTLPEIAFAGRSNVGKSSLLNKLFNRKGLAKVSQTPGKTATINFFACDGVRFVDLPGYGYAKVSKVEQEKWAKMINRYLSNRYNLVQVVQLVDSRHKPTADDKTMMDWIRSYNYSPVVVATKLDKLKKSQIEKNLTVIYNELRLDDDCVLLPFSAEKRTGREEFLELIESLVKSV